ncbi:MAG: replication-associated recombination protein A [Candidatus Omnitrophica bacterium]|nr:replication-associated recombination protein A [Candidatus Omnitrophota bacterium]MDE2009559.1 replication-associated recombination protein A [Candidatus Omnitrophota bacterium]MDE2214603.1 replication-associated recombination protein A [Candidatus Omnitrophota bacterium]MDE2231680.1 replication-associated recombination protein A [Candidatus Omnitrophota bacterium]
MSTLFSSDETIIPSDAPLSARMRPRSIEEYVGQRHILGEGKLLKRAIEADRISSLILYGPPGAGKTSLALCIAHRTNAHFERINAVSSNVEEMRKIIAAAQHRRGTAGRKTIVFIDEIHRFNKAQQDVLMPDIEEGNIILIGATVFNPFFALVAPLLSRSLIFELDPLAPEDLMTLMRRAIADKEKGLGALPVDIDDDALAFLSSISDGDARKALNALEVAVLTSVKSADGRIHITMATAQESIQKKQVNYDRDGDAHYDTISAFIKSMRGSDPDAALYWMAKMIYAGEDPRFIARRVVICASEDVGNADPQALVVANAALQAAEFVGLPEARIILAQAAVYVACAPKSNAVYVGIDRALDDVKNRRTQEVPAHLKDAHYKGADKLEHGKGYKYAHNYPQHHVQQEYMPDKAVYYEPTLQGYEARIKERMDKLKKK